MSSNHCGRFQRMAIYLLCLSITTLALNKIEASENPGAAAPAPVAASKSMTGIPPSEAKAHIGETNTVCGLVTGGRFLETAKNKPTFLNFEFPFPDHTFTAVIFEEDRAKFQTPPETLFDGKHVCVTGAIIDYRGKPEIVVHDPSQIVIQESTGAKPTVQSSPPTGGGATSSPSPKLPTKPGNQE
jgi:micrococcal nuclease